MAIRHEFVDVKWLATRVRLAAKGELNDRSQHARRCIDSLLATGKLSHAEHVRAMQLVDNAFSNRLVEGLPAQFRRQLIQPMRVSA